MAKRKRLTSAQPEYLQADSAGLETKSMFPNPRAPIAQVAGDAAAASALQELAGEVKRAKEEGRLIQAIDLDAIDAHYIARDRVAVDTAELSDLMHSIFERGQQAPIEVVALDDGRFGLISGWRRLTALRNLKRDFGDETDRFDTVLAILRRPETASDAYVSMVEENEIRLGLSYYERARIVAQAAGQGVFDSERYALLELFATASRAKRSKIGSYLLIYHALDPALRFGPALGERLGLALAKALSLDESFGPDLVGRLRTAASETPEAEQAVLEKALRDHGAKQALTRPLEAVSRPVEPMPEGRVEVSNGLTMAYSGHSLTLSGDSMSEALRVRLLNWLKKQAAQQAD